MSNDTVVSLAAPAQVSDPLTELLRSGARRLIEAAVSAEFEEYLSGFVQEKLPDGRQRVVRNGHLPERKILTGLGGVEVRVPTWVPHGRPKEVLVYPLARDAREQLRRLDDGAGWRSEPPAATRPIAPSSLGDAVGTRSFRVEFRVFTKIP